MQTILDLDREARLARAQELGFDVTTPLYRGTRKVPAETGYRTRGGRSTPSFASDPLVAATYAKDPQYGYQYRPGATVGVVYLKAQNPLDLRDLGEFTTLMSIFEKLNWDWRINACTTDIFGLDDALAIAEGLDALQSRGHSFRVEMGDGGLSSVSRMTDFDDVRERIDEIDEITDDDNRSEAATALFEDIEIDVYAVVDTPAFIEIVDRLGFDQVIHKDVFTLGAKVYEGDIHALEEGFDADYVVDTYRPVRPEYVRSIFSAFNPEYADKACLVEPINEVPRPAMRACTP